MSEKIFAERYRLVEKIGIGGMAIVYRAVDIRTGRDVAVKVLKPEYSQNAEFVSRFQREAEAASKMTHHNIVNLLDVGMDGDTRYLVMEYVRGKTLKDVIREKGRLNPQVAGQITIRILSALQHAHQHGIIHRDIKPQNILVHEDGHIKVADFGIARMTGASTLTHDDSVMGTVHYISPEQVSGREVRETSDIYSVGVVLYEMLTGHVPFDGENYVAIAMQHLHAQPRPIPQDVPPAIAHVCLMAMEKDPRYRYQSAAEMAAELKMALQGRTDRMQPRLAETPPPMPGAVNAPLLQTAPAQTMGDTSTRRPVRRRVRLRQIALMAEITALVFYGIYIGTSQIVHMIRDRAEVPDVVGLTADEAVRMAERSGLHCEQVGINHPSMAQGLVIQQAPEADTRINKGDTMVLTVSLGPSAQAVPYLIGMTPEEAVRALQTPGLTLSVTDRRVSSEIAAGLILSQAPEAGTESQPGGIVEVVVSGGVAYVPSLTGKSLNEAQDLLESAGLVPDGALTWQETKDASAHGTVAAQFPAADTQVIRGTAVSLTVWRVPSLTHSAEIELQLPPSQGPMSVRVTMTQSGEEKTVWASAAYPADATRYPRLEVYADAAGAAVYTVYVNDEWLYQMQMTLE